MLPVVIPVRTGHPHCNLISGDGQERCLFAPANRLFVFSLNKAHHQHLHSRLYSAAFCSLRCEQSLSPFCVCVCVCRATILSPRAGRRAFFYDYTEHTETTIRCDICSICTVFDPLGHALSGSTSFQARCRIFSQSAFSQITQQS
jgi:hypothetical protein